MDILTLVLFVLGFVVLVLGADWLVRGASSLATAVGISPLVVGLTVVAFGTSAPELAVSVRSSFDGQAGIAIGNVIGSNICNILLILGVAALITPLVVQRQLVRRDVPIMIGASLLLYALAFDGRLGRLDGVLLFAGVIIYTVYSIMLSRREGAAAAAAATTPELDDIETDMPLWKSVGLIVIGLVLLVIGARWLVDGAVDIARYFNVSELVIGLTLIALGTSLPELAASIVACLRNQGDVAVGNAIGSNLFNILSVLGLTSLVSPGGVPVESAALAVDMPIMIVVAVACLPIFFANYCIARWEGGLFFAYYLIYIAYLALTSVQHEYLTTFSAFVLFILPLTLITICVIAWRSYRSRHQA